MSVRAINQLEQGPVERVSGKRLVGAGAFALAATTAATVAVGLLEVATGILPQGVVNFQPIGIARSTLVQVGLGILVMALLSKYTRRPISTFRVVALAVLGLSMLGPIFAGLGLVPGISLGVAGVLGLMVLHVVAGAIAIWVLTTQVQDQ